MDATEFATLAAKRWFYYAREGSTAPTLEALQGKIAQDPHREIAFLLCATAAWAPANQVLALAYCRRTWCHHFALDFLAVRPGLSHRGHPVRGLGTGMIYGLVELAGGLGVDLIWGEATSSSAPFYERVLQRQPVQDVFLIRPEDMNRIREFYRTCQRKHLAQLTSPPHPV